MPFTSQSGDCQVVKWRWRGAKVTSTHAVSVWLSLKSHCSNLSSQAQASTNPVFSKQCPADHLFDLICQDRSSLALRGDTSVSNSLLFPYLNAAAAPHGELWDGMIIGRALISPDRKLNEKRDDVIKAQSFIRIAVCHDISHLRGTRQHFTSESLDCMQGSSRYSRSPICTP